MVNQSGPVIFGVSGFSKSGKTSLVVDLIKALKAKGYTIASVKNSDKDLSLDTEGKDTWKHKNAGAALTILNTNIESTLLFPEQQDPERLLEIIAVAVNPDIILVEGCKLAEIPKIWIESAGDEDCVIEKKNIVYKYNGEFDKLLVFVETELELNKIISGLPHLDCEKCGFATCRELADAIRTGDKKLEDCVVLSEEHDVELKSGGESVPLNEFAANMISGVVRGMTSELKEVKNLDDIEIKLHRKK
jgi:molybdopterin-guanine dinucleotide biosynthesis protein B